MAYPSTFLDLQNAVINKLRLDATADLQKVKDTINVVYAQVCVQIEANVTAATATLTANTASYTLPTAVARIKDLTVMPAGQTAYGPPLAEVSLGALIAFRSGSATTSGTVTYYTLAGLNQLELYPAPSGADTMLFYYVALPTALSGNTDVSILGEPYGSKVLEYGALAEMSDFLKGNDDTATDKYRGQYEAWLARFRAHLARRRGGHTLQLQVARAGTQIPHDPSTDTYAWA